MAKNLRLLLWEACNRSCAGCCNKQWDLTKLPVCTDYSPYDMIMFTGGEPMLNPDELLTRMAIVRLKNLEAKFIVYTADVRDTRNAKTILQYANGMTLTLHEQSDVEPFLKFAKAVEDMVGNKSLRLNVFKEVELDHVPYGWVVKDEIVWLENCPLPKDEVFMRYD